MRIKDIMGGGMSAGTAKALNGQPASLVMAGSTAATAALITSAKTLLTTASAGGAALPPSDGGDFYLINNESGNTCTLYPSLTAGTVTINTTTSVSLATAKSCIVWFSSPTACHTVPVVPS